MGYVEGPRLGRFSLFPLLFPYALFSNRGRGEVRESFNHHIALHADCFYGVPLSSFGLGLA